MQRAIGFTIVRRMLALLALAGTLQLAAMPGHAWAEYVEDYQEEYTDGYEGDGDSGPGTRWRQCRDTAWADYNECLMQDPDDTGNRAGCYILWDLDAGYCDWKLALELISVWKEIFK